ncbi:MAG: glycosyl hydrolase 53 family protein [Muribaculaceae bacterium]|nr:glycosyl hydrolase 53 family protein [Muribaculaceae bacterium]
MLKKTVVAALMTISLNCLSQISKTQAEPFWLGADISWTPELESRGIVNYTTDGQEMENTALMKHLGLNAIRLRVWVNSVNGFNTPQQVLEMAKRAKDLGMEIMIDFHYSDNWADPGHNNIPKEWEGLSVIEVKGKLADHTRSTLRLLKDNGIDVKWVQVGNETTNGMMWPIARIPDSTETYAELSNAGYDAVKEIYPDAQVIIHLDDGYNMFLYNYVFNALQRLGAKWDAIGMSVYPQWSNRDQSKPEAVDDVIANINSLAEHFKCPVIIVETGVNVNHPEEGYEFLSRLIKAAMNETNGNCTGVFYWEPEAPHSYNGGYDLGAFENFRPTKIMDAFTENSK